MSIEHFTQFSRFIFAGNEGFRRMAYRKKMYLKVNFSSFTLQDKGGGRIPPSKPEQVINFPLNLVLNLTLICHQLLHYLSATGFFQKCHIF